jgi:hypothetical protein
MFGGGNAVEFIKGLDLNRGFYADIVKPLLEKKYPALRYSAALLGYGSDVLGFDTEISMDHNWGPRLQIFIEDGDFAPKLHDFFSLELPFRYRNFPVNFTKPGYDHTAAMEDSSVRPVNHFIEVGTFEGYAKKHYALETTTHFTHGDWLGFTDQRLIELTAGEVFYDGLDRLHKTRKELAFYPPDILKLRMALLWDYLGNKEAFVGRSIALDDYIGLKLHVGRIVNYLIKLLFYLEGKYIPYSKWLGTAFKRLASYNDVRENIVGILDETDPRLVEQHLCGFYEKVIEQHNKTAGLPRLHNRTRNYFNRPYKVIFAETIAAELKNSIEDDELRKTDLTAYGTDIIMDR